MRGKPAGPPADVYALGAILFELLASEPLHPRGDGALASTLAHPTRTPQGAAPELAERCLAALAEDARGRIGVRALADGVQRYLDGDRDLEVRRAHGASEIAAARELLSAREPEAREHAIRHASRALAFDSTSAEAWTLVTQLVREPPLELSPRLRERLREASRARIRSLARPVCRGTRCAVPLAGVSCGSRCSAGNGSRCSTAW